MPRDRSTWFASVAIVAAAIGFGLARSNISVIAGVSKPVVIAVIAGFAMGLAFRAAMWLSRER